MAQKKPDAMDMVSYVAAGEINSVPAIITNVVDRDQGIVDLIAFFDPTRVQKRHTRIEFHYNVGSSDDGAPNTWREPIKGPQ